MNVCLFILNSFIVFRPHKSPNPDGESSASQVDSKNNARTSEKQERSHQGTLSQRSKQLPGHDHSEEHKNDDDDRRHPPDPPGMPEAEPHRREITHDTDIRLKILIDGTDKGDFLELETSVKVCWMA